MELKCQKISDYLTSFLANGNENTNFRNSSDVDVSKFPTLNLSLNCNNESRVPNIKTNTLPNNVEEFHRRLKSFECGLWTCTAISPLLCATYGWKLIEKDILSCVTCKALICTSLPLPNQIEAYKVFSGKLKERLRTGHKDWCEWPNNPSPPEYLHPPLHMTVHYANNLVKKANNLLKLGNRIPYINCEEILKKLGLRIKEISSFFNIHPELSENHLTATLLILCGWGCEGKEKLQCSLCFRSIGLWNFLPLSEGSHYLELEKKSSEREEKRKMIEEKKKQRERILLIKEEKLKAKLLEEKKAALAEMEAKERALKVKLTLEEISKLENSDLSNPSDDSEDEEEMGEEEENLLLNEDESNEFVMEEEEGNTISEPDFTAAHSVGTNTKGNVLSDACYSQSVIENASVSEYVPEAENEEIIGSKTHDTISDTESEGNPESEECSKSCNGNESDEDLWLEAVGGYVEESGSNMSKPVYSPSSEQSGNSTDCFTENAKCKGENNGSSEDENCIDYPTDNTNSKRNRGGSSEDENSTVYPSDNANPKRNSNESSEDESTVEYYIDNSSHKRRRSGSSEIGNGIDYPTEKTNFKKRRSENMEDEYSIEYQTENKSHNRNNKGNSDGENSLNNTNRKRCRSTSSEDEYIEEGSAKCRRIEEVCEAQNTQSDSNGEDIPCNESNAISNFCENNENLACDMNNENEPLHTETQESNPENVEEEEMDEEEIEEVEEDPEEIDILNKMRKSLFQPLEQHRHWCGWMVRYTSLYIDKDEIGIEGFKIIPPQIPHFQPDIPDSSIITSEKYAGNIVGLRTVRGILESWSRHQDEEDLQEL